MMQAGPFKMLSLMEHDGIGLLKLSQPPTNRMSRLFFEEFSNLVDSLKENNPFRALIISGSGRHFSQGADLDDLLKAIEEEGMKESTSFFNENRKSFQKLHTLDMPVIAAIQGVCLGSALELALFCDFRICAQGALLALPETNFFLIPGCGGTQRLQQLVKRNKALELMLEGKNVSAEEALEWGLVDKICPKKDLLDAALTFAKTINADFNRDQRDHYLKSL